MVAERQGQTAARNMLGAREAFDAVPFFWSQHYDVPINYVGHAEKWDEIAIDGNIAGRDCLLKYKSGGRVLAVASIYRDLDSLKAELAMEQMIRSVGWAKAADAKRPVACPPFHPAIRNEDGGHGASAPLPTLRVPRYFSSAAVEVAGPSPMISNTASSSLAPSQCTCLPKWVTKLPAGIGVVLAGSNFGPVATHQVPCSTVM